MRVTIVPADGTMTVDGKTRSVDCSLLIADDVRVLQWRNGHGVIEYNNELGNPFRLNEEFEDLTPYKYLLDAWTAAVVVEPARFDTPQAYSGNELEIQHINNLRGDYSREDFIAMIKGSDSSGIRAYVDQTVTDLNQVKEYLVRLTLLVATDIRR